MRSRYVSCASLLNRKCTAIELVGRLGGWLRILPAPCRPAGRTLSQSTQTGRFENSVGRGRCLESLCAILRIALLPRNNRFVGYRLVGVPSERGCDLDSCNL